MESLYHIQLVQVTLEVYKVLLATGRGGGGGGGWWVCGTGRPGAGGEGGLGGTTDTLLTVLVYLAGEQEVALLLVVSEVLALG